MLWLSKTSTSSTWGATDVKAYQIQYSSSFTIDIEMSFICLCDRTVATIDTLAPCT